MSPSILEMPQLEEQISIKASNEAEFVASHTVNGPFSEEEIQSMHRDDEVAGGVIAVMLGMAFLVLLGLVTGVNIWMMSVTH